MEIENSQDVLLRLKKRPQKAKMFETILYGYVAWSPNSAGHDRLPQVHRRMLLRCIDWWNLKREDHTLSYAPAPVKTNSWSIEVTVHRRRVVFVPLAARIGE